MTNGGMLALCARERDHKITIATHEIFAAHTHLGTLAIALAEDDSWIGFTGSKRQ
jgi:hypothetical protein